MNSASLRLHNPDLIEQDCALDHYANPPLQIFKAFLPTETNLPDVRQCAVIHSSTLCHYNS